MLASPAHLYMPHLFTHCLPTIICVMLMSIAFFFYFFYFCYMLLFVTPFWIVCDNVCLCYWLWLISIMWSMFCYFPVHCPTLMLPVYILITALPHVFAFMCVFLHFCFLFSQKVIGKLTWCWWTPTRPVNRSFGYVVYTTEKNSKGVATCSAITRHTLWCNRYETHPFYCCCER